MARTARTPAQWEQDRREELGHAVREARKEIPLSVRELAARTHVSESAIRKIEGGKIPNPGLFTIAALAITLNLDISETLRSFTEPLQAHRS